jgi:hypothetical protein
VSTFNVTEKKARLFMLKIREAMSSCENFPLNSEVHVDDFVLGCKETNKAGRSYNSKKKRAIAVVQNTENGKVKKYMQ